MSSDRTHAKFRIFEEFAQQLGSLSVCRRRSVGAVIVPPDFTEVLSIGYNGPPSGTPHTACTGVDGACSCTHAELNALVKLRTERQSLVLITTLSPCLNCASLIANCRSIALVVYSSLHSDISGFERIEAAGKQIVPSNKKELLCDLLHALRRS